MLFPWVIISLGFRYKTSGAILSGRMSMVPEPPEVGSSGTEYRSGVWDSMRVRWYEGKSSELEIKRNKSNFTHFVSRTLSLTLSEPSFPHCKMGAITALFAYDYGNQMIIYEGKIAQWIQLCGKTNSGSKLICLLPLSSYGILHMILSQSVCSLMKIDMIVFT